MPMADYAFYTDVYLGSAIPEKAFPGMALRAREVLNRFQRSYQVTVPGEDSLKMALCAMAENSLELTAEQTLSRADAAVLLYQVHALAQNAPGMYAIRAAQQ